jgi:alkylhydroperoxidase family enzyme
MIQEAIVALIVVVAAAYLAWRWMPKRWRRAAAGQVAAGSQRAGLVDAEQAEALARSLAKDRGCGACASCAPSCASKGGVASPAEGQAPAPGRAAQSEVRLMRQR